MSDAASLFSTTETLVDVPQLTTTPSRTDGDVGSIHVALWTSYMRGPLDADKLTRVGFPANAERGQSSTSINPLSSLKRRVCTRVPVRELRDQFERRPGITTVEELDKVLKSTPNFRKTKTLWDSQLWELVGIHSRARLSIVCAYLYKALDVDDSFGIFPASRVVSAPSKLLSKSGEVKVDMKWISLLLTSPRAARDMRESGTEAAREALYSRFPTLRPGELSSAQEMLSRLYTPSEDSQRDLMRIVKHLESRGAIIHDVGEDSRPSAGRWEPGASPRYHIIGIFPKTYIDHVKRSTGKPLRSDVDASPLIVRTSDQPDADSLRMSGSDKNKGSGDGDADIAAAMNEDPLAGWEAKVVEEPFVSAAVGSAAFSGVGGFAMAAGVASGGC